MADWVRTLLALAGSTLVGGLAFWRGSLSASGWLAAVAVGTAALAAGGWTWGALILVFFAASTALSKVGRAAKAKVAAETWDKGDRRDGWQVLANGGLPAALALAYVAAPHPAWWFAALGAVATAAADTWATEIGVLAAHPPRHLLSLRPLPPGTSGGVSLPGFLAAAAGAGLIGAVAFFGATLEAAPTAASPLLWVAALVGGFGGALVDSALGATVQAVRWCPSCERETEQRRHGCGTPTHHHRGLPWMDNDVVNALSLLAGSGLALLFV